MGSEQWLFSALAETGLPVICVETRQMRAALQPQRCARNRPDLRGGTIPPGACGDATQMLLTHRKLPPSKTIAIENDLRATLRNFGLKVGVVGMVKFEERIRELVQNRRRSYSFVAER